MKFLAKSILDTEILAKSLGEVVKEKNILALRGDLGAGKTSFTRALAEGMGINPDSVSSPTFTIMQVYRTDASDLQLCHFDLYRLNDSDDFYSQGLADYFDHENIAVVLEWPDIIEDILPEDRLDITIEVQGDDVVDLDSYKIILATDSRDRQFTLNATGDRSSNLAKQWIDSPHFPYELLLDKNTFAQD